MEVVKRRKKNSKKQPCYGDQPESRKQERDKVSIQILYPTIYSNKLFKSLKPCKSL